MAALMPERECQNNEDHQADDADRRVLAVQVGARTFLDGSGDLLHARGARVGGQDLLADAVPVVQRQQPEGQDQRVGENHQAHLPNFGRPERRRTRPFDAAPGRIAPGI